MSAKQPKRKQPAPKSPNSKPKHSRTDNLIPYKPGHSGNPKGRPLGSKNVKGAFDAISALHYGAVQFPGGVIRELTATEKIANKVAMKAMKGDLRAADMYFDRVGGRVPVSIKNIGEAMGNTHIQLIWGQPGEVDIEKRTKRTKNDENQNSNDNHV